MVSVTTTSEKLLLAITSDPSLDNTGWVTEQKASFTPRSYKALAAFTIEPPVTISSSKTRAVLP